MLFPHELRKWWTKTSFKCVYLIEAPELGILKIGYTNNILRRLYGLRATVPIEFNLIGIIDGDLSIERKLHRKFRRHYHIHEWYWDTDKIRSYFTKRSCWTRKQMNLVNSDKIRHKPGRPRKS